jgi:hypothetical protein
MPLELAGLDTSMDLVSLRFASFPRTAILHLPEVVVGRLVEGGVLMLVFCRMIPSAILAVDHDKVLWSLPEILTM